MNSVDQLRAGRAGAATTALSDRVDLSVKVTEPDSRRVRLSELWTTLPIAWMLGRRDMKVKYKQSALGPLWLFLQPLGLLLAVVVAFTAVTSIDTGDVPYVVFALIGLSAWTFVQMTFSASTLTLPSNNLVVRRSPCPRLPLISGMLIAVFPPLSVVLGVSLLGAVISGKLAVQVVTLPVMLLWLLFLMWGISLLVAAMSARFRDVVAFAPLVVQAGLFVTPVGYPLSSSDRLAHILAFNPVSGVIEAWRWAIVDMSPNMFAVGVSLAETGIFVLVGWFVFTRMERRFADYV